MESNPIKNVDNTKNTQAVLSLCPGILGLERGIERAIRALAKRWNIPLRGGKALDVVAYVEIEAFIIANLVGQMEAGLLDPAPIWTNVKTFEPEPFRDKIHGIIGGYPCQPFSHAGERRGVEDERHLYPYISQQIKIIRPEWVYFENVAGHLTMGYDEVRRDLSNIGYRVEEGIFTAEEVGAPHRRERLFIFGVLDDAGILGWGRRFDGPKESGSKSENQIEGSGSDVDDPNIECQYGSPCSCGRRQPQPSIPSRELADTNFNDTGATAGHISTEEGESTGEKDKRQWDRNEFRACGAKLAHADSSGQQEQRSNGEQIKSDDERIVNSNTLSVKSGVVLDDTVNEGLQGHAWNDSGERRWPQQERSVAETSLFPAGQGPFQYEWEEPRTIESRLVYTIDGYNFTEDLHRAIGNSVVEQTAELAFITLLEKHLKNEQ